MKIHDDAIYLGDNGRAYCGAHLGMTARSTGRDLSGQPIYQITPEDVQHGGADILACEDCGKKPSALHLP